MTAPDVNDVRARFEAWVQGTRGWAACKARNKPMYLRQTADGNYCDYRVNDRWMAYRAAHADMAGEARELVEALELAKRAYWLARNSAAGLTNYCEESASSRRCERELSEAESLWHSAGIEAALAKFHPTHQEKP